MSEKKTKISSKCSCIDSFYSVSREVEKMNKFVTSDITNAVPKYPRL